MLTEGSAPRPRRAPRSRRPLSRHPARALDTPSVAGGADNDLPLPACGGSDNDLCLPACGGSEPRTTGRGSGTPATRAAGIFQMISPARALKTCGPGNVGVQLAVPCPVEKGQPVLVVASAHPPASEFTGAACVADFSTAASSGAGDQRQCQDGAGVSTSPTTLVRRASPCALKPVQRLSGQLPVLKPSLASRRHEPL